MRNKNYLEKKYKQGMLKARDLAAGDLKNKSPDEISNYIMEWQEKFNLFENIRKNIESSMPQLFEYYLYLVLEETKERLSLEENIKFVEVKRYEKEIAFKSYFEKKSSALQNFLFRKNLKESEAISENAYNEFQSASEVLQRLSEKIASASLELVRQRLQKRISEIPLNVELNAPKSIITRHVSSQTINTIEDLFLFLKRNSKLFTLSFYGDDVFRYAFQREYLQSLKKAIPEARKQQGIKRLKSQAALNKGTQRNLSVSLRNRENFHAQLSIITTCPYCQVPFDSDDLTKNVHLDHIYPVNKGGHSVIENLIFICDSCNIKKSDTTLAKFCEENKYEFEKITKTLLMLGKDV